MEGTGCQYLWNISSSSILTYQPALRQLGVFVFGSTTCRGRSGGQCHRYGGSGREGFGGTFVPVFGGRMFEVERPSSPRFTTNLPFQTIQLAGWHLLFWYAWPHNDEKEVYHIPSKITMRCATHPSPWSMAPFDLFGVATNLGIDWQALAVFFSS